MYEQARFCMNGQFDIGQINPLRYFLGIAVFLGFLFAFIAPDDNDSKNIFLLLIHWQLQTLIPMALLILSHLFLHPVRIFKHLNPWIKLLFSGLAGITLYAPIGLALDLWIQKEQIGKGMWLSELSSEIAALGPPILVAWIAINAPWIIGFRVVKVANLGEISPQTKSALIGDPSQESSNVDTTQKQSLEEEKAREEQPSFLQLMPEPLGREILYMQAELHYLRIVTTRGAGLILYNLKDAMKELASAEGFQCHRSFWVATESVSEFKKEGRQGELLLRNGDRVPVSRSNMEYVSAQLASND